ncbi:TonB-dependent receptor [Gallaecimonas sp. GXIMD4217]|uniref:TonB-dependent receptor n=1 Tax=Gallaecimonas sp. GXIMD4217 TaxID=3131927 RepID=UPI00311ACE35
MKNLFTLSPIALALLAGTVQAAPQLEDVERIQVTGSHIQRSDWESHSPITVIDKAQIARSGINNLEELLQELSLSAGPAGNATNAYWTSNGYGTAQVDLRGLGIKRTLVLLNGRRLINGGTGANDAVDLNLIPLPLIERIEVLRDGASAIYGADAVAGVVNLITRKAMDGVELFGQYGQTSKGDGAQRSLNLLAGTRLGDTELALNLNYVNTDAVLQSARHPCPLEETEQGLECIGSGSTLGGRAHLADGTELQFNQDPGGDGDFFEAYDPQKHGFNWFPFLNAVSPSERFNAALTLSHELSDELLLSAELIHGHRESEQIVTPRTLRSASVSAAFPFNPTGQDLTLKKRRILEAGVPFFYQETDITQGTLALEGSLAGDYQWQLSWSRGINTARDGWSQDYDQQRIQATLDESQCSTAPGAAIPCGDYFGVGDLSPAVLDHIGYQREGSGGNELDRFAADINGDLYELPAGPLAFAAGIEYRQESGWRDPDPVVLANGGEDAIRGETRVREVFGELALPLAAELSGVKSLELSLALRHSDYDDFDAKTTYKAGLKWVVNDHWMLRAVRSTAFRAPSITERFGGTNQENLLTIDPCDGATGTIAANCLADGVPAGFQQDGSTILTGVGGNPDVQPEEADTLNLGLILEYGDLSASLDYFDIRLDDAIGSVGGTDQLRLCYTAPRQYAGFCQGFERDPITHQVTLLTKRPINVARERVRGLDLSLSYRHLLLGLDSQWQLDATRLLEHERTAFPGAETEQLLGLITADQGSFAKWRANASWVLAGDAWTLGWTGRLIGKADDQNGGGPIGRAVPTVVYHDLSASYRLGEDLELRAGIDNLFDKAAPFLTSWNDANTDVFTYDLLGRRWRLGLNYRF